MCSCPSFALARVYLPRLVLFEKNLFWFLVCSWVNNCVGRRNQKYFILFIVYVFLGEGYSLCMAIGRGIVCLPKSAKVFSSVSMRYFLFTLPILTVYVPCACCAVHRSNASFRLTHLPSCRHFIHLLFCVCRCDGVRPGTCTHDACLFSVTSDDSMHRC